MSAQRDEIDSRSWRWLRLTPPPGMTDHMDRAMWNLRRAGVFIAIAGVCVFIILVINLVKVIAG